MKDILIFKSDSFSIDPPFDERGVRYDLPLGEDICEFLKQQFELNNASWKIDSPTQVDYGAVLLLCRGKDVFKITTSWQGDNSWALIFGQMHGCLGFLFNTRPALQAQQEIAEIKMRVHEVVSSDTTRFRNVTWIDEKDFAGVAQVFVIPK